MGEIFNTALMIALSTVLTLLIIILLIRLGGASVNVVFVSDEKLEELLNEEESDENRDKEA